jgi:hypothetical protein
MKNLFIITLNALMILSAGFSIIIACSNDMWNWELNSAVLMFMSCSCFILKHLIRDDFKELKQRISEF